jgi:Reverse transcriptase (RNA-dependent DNA polymerase)
MMIDAKVQRDVATADVQGAYLNALMDDFVLVRITGVTVDVLCAANQIYKQFVTTENGTPVVYLQVLKALYGCVKSALLWYDLFSSVLRDMGFEINPYDPCVANKIINGSQCTVAWYVDDTKISHTDPNVVSDIISSIEQHFGEMTKTRGTKHTFLGMDVTFNSDSTVTISMTKFIDETISESGIALNPAGCMTSARSELFDIDDSSPALPSKQAEVFHRIVAKLLYLSKRGRPDIQLAVAFLTTRVSKSTEQDWTKLTRLLQYLQGTRELHVTLGADSLSAITTWTDASYAVHPDMRSHTGGAISLGTGAIMCKSTKQKLNTKSSTEAEVVGASDFLPSTIWARYFLQAQGYTISNNSFLQDNKSAILLERNGRASSSQRTRHIDIRYFFFKDRITSENIQVIYCPTDEMLADFFTKPLQGVLFRKFRDVILGYKHISSLHRSSPSPMEPSSSFSPSLPIAASPTTAAIEERVGVRISTTPESADPGWTRVTHNNRKARNSPPESHSFETIQA